MIRCNRRMNGFSFLKAQCRGLLASFQLSIFFNNLVLILIRWVLLEVLSEMQGAQASDKEAGPVEASGSFGSPPEGILLQPFFQKQAGHVRKFPHPKPRTLIMHSAGGPRLV